MLEKLPGVASADADKTTSSATIIYDKSIFDTSSVPDGRYTFELRQDSASEEEAAGESESSNEEQASDETEAESSSMIKIEDAPAEGSSSKSEENGDEGLMPSLDGPSS